MNSKNILDSDFTENKKPKIRIFSKRYIQKINNFELIFFTFIASHRIGLIHKIINTEFRELIHINDYESGWTFIVITFMIITNLIQRQRIISANNWLIKYSGYLCLFHLVAMKYTLSGIIIFMMIIYYSLNKVSKQFHIENPKKLYYIAIAFLFAFLVFYLDHEYPILNY